VPILISNLRTDTLCNPETYVSYVPRTDTLWKKAKSFLNTESSVTKSNCQDFMQRLLDHSDSPKVLIIGGAEKGEGVEALYRHEKIEVDTTDIYASEYVDLIADAHYLPISDSSYDGVWIQAVLEHVVDPDRVCSEIYRILKTNGIVYSETPFMQQVHEGAYDFTRYTVTGHRYLFRNFSLISLGGLRGSEVVLAWSLKYFVWSLTRSKKIGQVVGVVFALILKPFSLIASKESLFDAASGVYFMGEKIPGHSLSHRSLVDLYKGMQKK